MDKKEVMEIDKIGIILELVCLIGIAFILFSFRMNIYNFFLPLMVFNGYINSRGYFTADLFSIFISISLIMLVNALLHLLFYRIRSHLKMRQMIKQNKCMEV